MNLLPKVVRKLDRKWIKGPKGVKWIVNCSCTITCSSKRSITQVELKLGIGLQPCMQIKTFQVSVILSIKSINFVLIIIFKSYLLSCKTCLKVLVPRREKLLRNPWHSLPSAQSKYGASPIYFFQVLNMHRNSLFLPENDRFHISAQCLALKQEEKNV